MEAPSNYTVSDQSSPEHIFSDVPLFATYMKIFLLLLIPTMVIPASVIIYERMRDYAQSVISLWSIYWSLI